jgi:hypothetical protein
MTGICSICGSQRQLKKDGGIYRHDRWIQKTGKLFGGHFERCPGSGIGPKQITS